MFTHSAFDSAYKIYKRTFSSPPYKPVKPEIPTYIKMEDYTNVHAFVMKLQQYHPDYTQLLHSMFSLSRIIFFTKCLKCEAK
ncbi:hypothetical protein YC2023_048096 [Brassica napus]